MVKNMNVNNKIVNLIKTEDKEDINVDGSKAAIISLALEIVSIILFYEMQKISRASTDSDAIWVSLIMIFLICFIGGVHFRKKSKEIGYKGILLKLGSLGLVVQLPFVILAILVFIVHCVDYNPYDPIYSWMSWKQIAMYSGGDILDKPVQLSHNTRLLSIVIYSIGLIQLIITRKRAKSEKSDWIQILLWFTVIVIFAVGIISGYFMESRASKQTFVFSELCKDIKYYPITDQFGGDTGAIYKYCFTSKIYVFLAIIIFSTYAFMILAVKMKKIPWKIITGALAGIILSYGIVTFVYSQKMETWYNDYVSIYYTGDTTDSFFD